MSSPLTISTPAPRVARLRVYVDGQNMYYGVVKRHNVKWLDLNKLMSTKITRHLGIPVKIEKLYLFTALNTGKKEKARQLKYIKALGIHGNNKFHWVEGKMKKKDGFVTVQASNEQLWATFDVEKMTDVSIGITVVNDACKAHGNDFDIACLVSNDSDMLPVFDMMKSLDKRLLWLSPLPTDESKNVPQAPVNKELERMVPVNDQIITGFTFNEMVDSQLPETVGEHKPPNHVGWGMRERER